MNFDRQPTSAILARLLALEKQLQLSELANRQAQEKRTVERQLRQSGLSRRDALIEVSRRFGAGET